MKIYKKRGLRIFVSVLFVLTTLFFASGCQLQDNLGSGQNKTPGAETGFSLDIMSQQFGCNSQEECGKFCEANPETCGKFCSENPGACPEGSKPEGVGGPMADTECVNPTLIAKMKSVVDNALVSPPAKIENLNWMTKILPVNNPYPGYYYDISTAFGPAIDEAIASGMEWSGEGEPPMAAGKFHYSFGFWDEVPKGKGATLGQETPETIDFSKYQLAIFYTNTSGSQDEMINAIQAISITESEARALFYSVFKKSFIDLDQKSLVKKGNKFYEAQWKDSDKTNDYWDVQIGEGYISIGQGKVYSEESALAGNVGTIWIYNGCRPCDKCDEWTKGTELNRDCTTNSDCKSGLTCNEGYCIKCDSSTCQGASAPQTGEGAGEAAGAGGPGSSCTTDSNCGSGLTCKNSVCSIPMGGP